MLDLQVRVFHDPPIASPQQAGRQGLPIRASLDLALASRFHPQMEDMEFRLTEQAQQAQY